MTTEPVLQAFLTSGVPLSLRDAVMRKYEDFWRAGIEAALSTDREVSRENFFSDCQDEYINQQVNIPSEKSPGSPSCVELPKARLVARGSQRIFSLDYVETYSPVVNFISLHFLWPLLPIWK